MYGIGFRFKCLGHPIHIRNYSYHELAISQILVITGNLGVAWDVNVVEVVLHVAPFITILSFTFLFKKRPVKLYRNSMQGIRSYWQNALHSEDLSWLELCVLFSEYILVGNICAFAKLASIELKNFFQGKFWIFMSMVVSSE